MKFYERKLLKWFSNKREKYPYIAVTDIKYPRPELVNFAVYGHFCRIPLKSKKIALWGFAESQGAIKFDNRYNRGGGAN